MSSDVGLQFNYDLYVIIIGIYKDLVGPRSVIKAAFLGSFPVLKLLCLMFIAVLTNMNRPTRSYVQAAVNEFNL